MNINILAVGDVVGNTGLEILSKSCRQSKTQKASPLPLSMGKTRPAPALPPRQAEDFWRRRDVITLGNHTFSPGPISSLTWTTALYSPPGKFCPAKSRPRLRRFWDGLWRCMCDKPHWPLRMNFGTENPFFAADKIAKETKAKNNAGGYPCGGHKRKARHGVLFETVGCPPYGGRIPTCRRLTPMCLKTARGI